MRKYLPNTRDFKARELRHMLHTCDEFSLYQDGYQIPGLHVVARGEGIKIRTEQHPLTGTKTGYLRWREQFILVTVLERNPT